MFDASRLVRYGYFPRELPPCFTTKDLSDHIADGTFVFTDRCTSYVQMLKEKK